MGQLTPKERRCIRLNKHRASVEPIRQLSAPLSTSRSRFRRVYEIAVIAVLLTAGWLVSHVVELHPPTSIEDMVPRL